MNALQRPQLFDNEYSCSSFTYCKEFNNIATVQITNYTTTTPSSSEQPNNSSLSLDKRQLNDQNIYNFVQPHIRGTSCLHSIVCRACWEVCGCSEEEEVGYREHVFSDPWTWLCYSTAPYQLCLGSVGSHPPDVMVRTHPHRLHD